MDGVEGRGIIYYDFVFCNIIKVCFFFSLGMDSKREKGVGISKKKKKQHKDYSITYFWVL